MSNDWRDEFRSSLANLTDQAVVSGAKQADVFEATIEEIECLRIANERVPDPADDVSEDAIEEPANDWPVCNNRQSLGLTPLAGESSRDVAPC